ncbi:MAG TPA: sugar ABC transporter substrate-binding protein [Burkholderiales bacterium]|nr:sugar ABC transporter substrate-binding protein [Burkholderiales bacterium]
MSSAPTLAVFTKNLLNPAYKLARLAADRAAVRLGVRVIHYVPEKPDDIEQQIALIDEALGQRPDAFVFNPVHETAIDGAIRRVKAQGVPIVNFINRMRNPDDYACFVGADDYDIGTRVSERLFGELGGRGNVAVLEGTPGAATGAARVRAFLDNARRHAGIRIVGRRNGAFLEKQGREAMEALLRECPQIDGVLAANHDMAAGAITALEHAARRALIVSVNATPEAIGAIRSGKLLATADFNAAKIAAVAAEAAVKLLRGESLPHEILLPVEIVDAANWRQFENAMV